MIQPSVAGSFRGSARTSSGFAMLKSSVLAPMASASVSAVIAA